MPYTVPNRMGQRAQVPAGLRGICPEGHESTTKGDREAITSMGERFEGEGRQRHMASTGTIGFWLPCPVGSCRHKVSYITDVAVKF